MAIKKIYFFNYYKNAQYGDEQKHISHATHSSVIKGEYVVAYDKFGKKKLFEGTVEKEIFKSERNRTEYIETLIGAYIKLKNGKRKKIFFDVYSDDYVVKVKEFKPSKGHCHFSQHGECTMSSGYCKFRKWDGACGEQTPVYYCTRY